MALSLFHRHVKQGLAIKKWRAPEIRVAVSSASSDNPKLSLMLNK